MGRDDGSRWWCPALAHGCNAGLKNGSTVSELRRRCACVHHGSGHYDPPDTRLRRESLVPRQRAPLGRVIPTTTSVPPCSGLPRRGLETTPRAASAERRPALTAPVRAGLQHVWVGAKKRDSKSNNQSQRLTHHRILPNFVGSAASLWGEAAGQVWLSKCASGSARYRSPRSRSAT